MNDTHIKEFFSKLDAFDNKYRVNFKRSCGMLIKNTDAVTMRLFFSILPSNVTVLDEDKWFAAASIHCLWDADEKNRKPMDECIGRYYVNPENTGNGTEGSKSFEKRFSGLLDTPWDEDGYLCIKLERLAKLLKQKGYAIDGTSLLYDLLHWNHDDKFIQKKWIRTYYRTSESDN